MVYITSWIHGSWCMLHLGSVAQHNQAAPRLWHQAVQMQTDCLLKGMVNCVHDSFQCKQPQAFVGQLLGFHAHHHYTV